MDYPRIISDPMYSVYQSRIEKEVRAYEIPQHIAVIMDGNRRYAKEVLGTDDTNKGHEMGKSKLREVLDWCIDLGIRYLTVYAFSMENFNRDDTEVDYLMHALASSLREFAADKRIHEYEVSIRVIGDTSLLPDYVIDAMTDIKYDHIFLLANGYADFRIDKIVPYVGLGLGYSFGREEATITDINKLLKNQDSSKIYEKYQNGLNLNDLGIYIYNRYKSKKYYYYTTNYIGFSNYTELKKFKEKFDENDYRNNPLYKIGEEIYPSVESIVIGFLLMSSCIAYLIILGIYLLKNFDERKKFLKILYLIKQILHLLSFLEELGMYIWMRIKFKSINRT